VDNYSLNTGNKALGLNDIEYNITWLCKTEIDVQQSLETLAEGAKITSSANKNNSHS